MTPGASRSGWIAALGGAALIGLAVFGTMLWRTVSIETLASAHARERFDTMVLSDRTGNTLFRADG